VTNIANIRVLKGAAVLAERKAASPSLDLKRFNLFYGFNGSGKSTLSRVFAALQHGAKHPRLPQDCIFEIEMSDGARVLYPQALTGLEKRVCVFNNDFIEQNLRWESGRASPIFYIGSDQAEAAGRLKALEGTLPAERERHAGENKVLKEREKAFTEYKRGLARTVSQHLRQAARYEAPQFVADVEKLGGSGEPLSSTDLDAAIATCARSEPPSKVKTVEVSFSDLLETIQATAEIAGKSIGTIVIEELDQHPEMVPWVSHGHAYHAGHDLASCLYCGSPISNDRKELLTAALDDKLSRFTAELDSTAQNAIQCVEALAAAKAAIPAAAQLSAEFQPAFESAASELTVALDDVSPLLTTALNALRERQRTPTNSVAVALPTSAETKTRVERLEKSCAAVNAVCKQHADMVDDFKEHQIKAREAIRRHFVLTNSVEYEDYVSGISDAETRESEAKAALEALEADIGSLRATVQQHGPAAGKINALIKSYLGHGELTIVPVTEGYELHRHNALVAGPPSEGEKTAIALCYFMSMLEAEDRTISNLIVVIDDPVSSLDTKAMNYACALIRNRLANASQLIVLTHNQHCMNEFKKFWKGWARAATATASLKFIDVSIPASSMARRSVIVDLPKHLREYESEYHYLFEKVIAFEAVGNGHFDYTFMMPNVMRRVLEVFLAFKIPHSGNLSDKLKMICERYSNLDQDRLHALERLSQVESHSDNLDDLLGQSAQTVEESRDANAALIHLMETVDAPHLSDLRKYCRS
jgi:wobble nucleotide-excising tRNase